MGNVQDAFKYNRARKNVIIGGAVILICITALSCVSSFMIYRSGFGDMPFIFQQALALFAVVVVEGAFVWLVYGFTRAFSSGMERWVSLAGMAFLVVVMMINLVTHFMMVKGIELHPFQMEWIDWGAVTIFVAVLLIVLFITLADPVIRLIRLELRAQGKKQEKILEAMSEALDGDQIQAAMRERADYEADKLADQIIGEANQRQLPRHGQAHAPGGAGYTGRPFAAQNQAGYSEQGADDPKDRRR
jgi:signal transduction histidine kinase